jgi:glycosyltransferase involved in cell wall biosynthesis
VSGPLVSIIIPCYNQGRFLTEAVESALGQSYPHVEVIVVNDGSTDETAEVAGRLAGRIQYLEQENRGVCVARNAGLLASRGEWLLFLDADDFLAPGTLQRIMEASAREPDVDVFLGQWHYANEKGEIVDGDRPHPYVDDAFHSLLEGNWAPVFAYFLRRSCFARAGIWPAGLTHMEEWDLWLRIAAAGCRFRYLEFPFAAYRRHGRTATSHFDRLVRGGREVLRRAPVHRRCAACRAAIRAGRWHIAEYSAATALWPQLRGLWGQRRWAAAASAAVGAAILEPRIVVRGAYYGLRRLKRTVLGPGAAASPTERSGMKPGEKA